MGCRVGVICGVFGETNVNNVIYIFCIQFVSSSSSDKTKVYARVYSMNTQTHLKAYKGRVHNCLKPVTIEDK